MSDERVLILETSGRVGLVALAQGEVLRGVRTLDEARRHARDLAPAVAELLAAESWRPRAITAVLVSRGPGSYTGLRVGIMSARAFAYATGCALIALDTFAVLADQAPPGATPIDVLADAQQGRVYVQRFRRAAEHETQEGPVAVTALSIQPFAEWLAHRAGPAWVTGPGLRVQRQHLPGDTPVVDPALWDPQVGSLLRLGLARYRAGLRDDLWSLEPLYLRPSSAEEKSGR